MPPAPSLRSLDPSTKTDLCAMGSLDSIPKFGDILKRVQELYSPSQLDELLWYFKIPNLRPPRPQDDAGHHRAGVCTCLCILGDVISACEGSRILTAQTAGKILQALDGVAYWMCIAMDIPLGCRQTDRDNFGPWSMKVYDPAVHSDCIRILIRLANLEEGLGKKICLNPLILDLCIMWNVMTRGGAPLIYVDGYTTSNGLGNDSIIGFTAMLAEKNIAGLATALQSRRVCDPKLYFSRASQRMKLLCRLETLPHLSELPDDNHAEVFNVCNIIATTNSIVQTDPNLAHLMLETRAPGKFIKAMAVATFQYTLHDVLSPELRARCLEKTFFYAKLVVAWGTLQPAFYLPTMKDLISKGAIRMLGHCLTTVGETEWAGLGVNQEEWSTQFAAMVSNILPWATSPALVDPIRSQLSSCVGPTICISNDNAKRSRILARMVAIVDRYALYSPQEKRVTICDNLNHIACNPGSRSQRSVEKACANCHSIVYCSPVCQRQDWEARHREECSEMRENYLRQKYTMGTRYSHNSRAYHSTIFGNIHTTKVDIFNKIKATMPGASPGGIERDPGGKVAFTIDPRDTIEPMSIDTLPDFIRTTIPLLPPYLTKRFRDLVEKLLKPNSQPSTGSRTMAIVNVSLDTGRGFEANIVALLRDERVEAYPRDPYPSFDIEASMVFTCPVRDRYAARGGMEGHQQRNFETLFGRGGFAAALAHAGPSGIIE